MDTIKTVYKKAVCGFACTLENAQRMARPAYLANHPEREKLKDTFIGPMWLDPKVHRKMMEEERNGVQVHKQG